MTAILLSTTGTADSDIWFVCLADKTMVRSYHLTDYDRTPLRQKSRLGGDDALAPRRRRAQSESRWAVHMNSIMQVWITTTEVGKDGPPEDYIAPRYDLDFVSDHWAFLKNELGIVCERNELILNLKRSPVINSVKLDDMTDGWSTQHCFWWTEHDLNYVPQRSDRKGWTVGNGTGWERQKATLERVDATEVIVWCYLGNNTKEQCDEITNTDSYQDVNKHQTSKFSALNYSKVRGPIKRTFLLVIWFKHPPPQTYISGKRPLQRVRQMLVEYRVQVVVVRVQAPVELTRQSSIRVIDTFCSRRNLTRDVRRLKQQQQATESNTNIHTSHANFQRRIHPTASGRWLQTM